MVKPLKDQNTLRLAAVVVGNLAVSLAIFNADSLLGLEPNTLTKKPADLAPATVAIALLTVANGLINPQMKARLVFWRWTNPLPGCRAFSEHVGRDPRINVGALEHEFGKLPEDECEQNQLWYRMYRTVESYPAVAHNHRDFLFTRDYAALSVLFLVVFGGLAIYQVEYWSRTLGYIAFLTAQYLIVRWAAAIYGIRFVSTVLAVKAAEN